MPQFIMPTGDRDETLAFECLDAFTRGYIEAAFFTDANADAADDLEDKTFGDITQSALEHLLTDCQAFQDANRALLEEAYAEGTLREGPYDAAQAGRDLWFTRNGHGVGFWDRGLGEVGDKLSEAVGYGTAFPEVYLVDWFY